MSKKSLCPCGSELSYQECCAKYIEEQELPETPDLLMRSRYTAFVKGSFDYLRATWHPETLPDDLSEDEPANWIGLEIIDWGMDEDEIEGEVEFKAKQIFDNKLEILHEVSSFDRIDGKWLYHSGEFKNDGEHITKISKTADCPCGSGKIFKKCHYEG